MDAAASESESGDLAFDFERIEADIGTAAHIGAEGAVRAASNLLRLGERVLEIWVAARGEIPTEATKEGFRLLALHRQGARGEPSFNACRETCRELVYHYNLITLDPAHAAVGQRIRMTALVARHLLLFVSGKMQVEGLGDSCCSSKPLRGSGK